MIIVMNVVATNVEVPILASIGEVKFNDTICALLYIFSVQYISKVLHLR